VCQFIQGDIDNANLSNFLCSGELADLSTTLWQHNN